MPNQSSYKSAEVTVKVACLVKVKQPKGILKQRTGLQHPEHGEKSNHGRPFHCRLGLCPAD